MSVDGMQGENMKFYVRGGKIVHIAYASEQERRLPDGRLLGNYSVWNNYSALGASTGQASAQAPQAMQSSEILYAIVIHLRDKFF